MYSILHGNHHQINYENSRFRKAEFRKLCDNFGQILSNENTAGERQSVAQEDVPPNPARRNFYMN